MHNAKTETENDKFATRKRKKTNPQIAHLVFADTQANAKKSKEQFLATTLRLNDIL